MSLREKIQWEIRDQGPMAFSRYMELCLYDADWGYYSRNAEQFGNAGDFYTSSDVHAVFGRLLARQFDEMWRVLGSPNQIEIMELGPGRGLFAQDVLAWAEKKFPDFFLAAHYSLVESSPSLRTRLQETLRQRIQAGKVSLCAGTREGAGKGANLKLPELRLPGRALESDIPIIVFANEFFDALPVEIISAKGKLQVSEQEGKLIESWTSPSAEEHRYLDTFSVRPEVHERVEVPLLAQDYISAVTKNIQRGFTLVIDYGYTRLEQLAGRHRGTLKAIRGHSVSSSPYEAPGEQDLTVDVNFTAIAAKAEENGMQVSPLLTQSQFLMGIGENNQFADAFEDCKLPQERAKVALQLKHLVTPAGMGENFHVLIASKGLESSSVSKLSGLSFGRRES